MTRFTAVRAITTRYRGYAFRSRLEARWAVFFDHLKIKWEYEPEGFELGNGLRYLPDFWLPDLGLWVEIKPGEPDDMAKEKAWRLCAHTDAPLFMSNGMPGNQGSLFWARTRYTGEVSLDCFTAWAPWNGPTIYTGEPGDERHFENLDVYPMAVLDTELYGAAEDALAAARSARFEFGEKGGAK